MKRVYFVLLVVGLSLICFGCNEEKAKEKAEFKVAMVTDVGGVNDQSFNQSAWEGLQKAKEGLKVDVSYIESKQDADYQSNLETLLDAQNDIIWAIGFKMADIVMQVATQNPEQKYGIIDFTYGKEVPDNIVCVMFKEQEASFLTGFIAAKMSKTRTIGFVGGMDVPVIHRFKFGFLAGAKYADPSIEILSQYAASFSDAAKGKAIANQMYKNGADVVMHAAGGVGDGVIEAAKEKNKMAIGVDRDQNDLAPENVITSSMKKVGSAIYKVTESFTKGEWQGGKTVVYGIKEGGVDIAPTTSNLVPAEILSEVENLKKEIVAGNIVTPASEEDYNKFLESL